MSHAFTEINIHLIFSTKGRTPWLATGVRARMFAYIAEVARSSDCTDVHSLQSRARERPMSRTPKSIDDPGVAEVRRWRAKVVKRAGGTVAGLMSLLRAAEAQRRSTRSRRPAGKRRRAA